MKCLFDQACFLIRLDFKALLFRLDGKQIRTNLCVKCVNYILFNVMEAYDQRNGIRLRVCLAVIAGNQALFYTTPKCETSTLQLKCGRKAVHHYQVLLQSAWRDFTSTPRQL